MQSNFGVFYPTKLVFWALSLLALGFFSSLTLQANFTFQGHFTISNIHHVSFYLLVKGWSALKISFQSVSPWFLGYQPIQCHEIWPLGSWISMARPVKSMPDSWEIIKNSFWQRRTESLFSLFFCENVFVSKADFQSPISLWLLVQWGRKTSVHTRSSTILLHTCNTIDMYNCIIYVFKHWKHAPCIILYHTCVVYCTCSHLFNYCL